MRFSAFAVLLIIAATLWGCGASPITPTPPTPEPNPPAPFPPPPPSPQLSLTRIVSFGDSMTEGQNGAIVSALWVPDVFQIVVPSQSYPFQLQAKLSRRYTAQTMTVINKGIGGNKAAADLSRLPGVLLNDRPELVLLLEGINDLNGGDTISRTAGYMDQMVKLCLAQNLRVMLAGVPPQRPGGQRAFSVELVTPYNNALRAVAQADRVEFIDIERAFGGNLSLLGPDGLHPNEAGYERIAQTFYDRIVAKYEVRATSLTLTSRGH